MIDNEKKVPEVRFKEFENADAWEQRELGELGEVTLNGVDKIINSDEKIVKLLNYMDVYNKRDINKNTYYDLMNTSATVKQLREKNVRKGDIFFTPSSETREDIGYSMVIKEDFDDLVYSYHIARFRPKNDIFDLNYSNYFANTNNVRKQFIIEAQGVQRITLSKSNIENLKITIPYIEEQQKIGEILLSVDNTITFHQRQLENYKKFKKAMLQKMFPKKDEEIPEIRFKEFEDAWKQCKLSELMSFSNGINSSKENYGHGTKMISVMDILDSNPIKYENIRNSVLVNPEVENKNKVENGDLVFVRSSEVTEEVGWAKAYLEPEYALYSGFSIRGKKKNEYDAYFIELALNYSNRVQIEKKAGGSTRFNVSQSILNEISILLPIFDEQNLISKLFKDIDNTITLHQQQLLFCKKKIKNT